MAPLALSSVKRRHIYGWAKSENLPTQKKLFYVHLNNVVLNFTQLQTSSHELSVYAGGAAQGEAVSAACRTDIGA